MLNLKVIFLCFIDLSVFFVLLYLFVLRIYFYFSLMRNELFWIMPLSCVDLSKVPLMINGFAVLTDFLEDAVAKRLAGV